MSRLLVLVFMITLAETAIAEQWYLSNAAGMTLEYIPSRIAALRNPYCLSIGFVPPGELPEYLQDYLKPSYQIEIHTLYEKGEESRRQWIFKDSAGIVRLVSAMNNSSEEEEPPLEEAALEEEALEEKDPNTAPTGTRPKGFIEIYDEYNLITEEHQFSVEGSESITNYFYNKQVLVRAETRLKDSAPAELEQDEPVITLIATDHYRYNRSNALRAVERVYHEEVSGENRLTRLQFPHLSLNAWVDEHFITPGTPYQSEFLQDILMNFDIKAGDRVVYTTDERGKVLTETRRDAEGTIQGEIRNIWAGDRLEAVEWKAKEDERRTEYEYDSSGDRILEQNYNKGVLERTVHQENGQEIEELYMHGVVILRAIWEDGRKISEEQVRSPRKTEDTP